MDMSAGELDMFLHGIGGFAILDARRGETLHLDARRGIVVETCRPGTMVDSV